jgi:hypothetical protein
MQARADQIWPVRQAVGMAARSCLFCGATPVSNEHAIPLWTGDAIPGSGPWVHRHVERHDDDPLRQWKKKVPDLKCRVPCKSCNNGWMSQLERNVKPVLTPLIQGRPTRLELHHLSLISYWAVKTSLMLDRCSDSSHQNIPASEFKELFVEKSALRWNYVWLGRCDAARGSWFQARTLDMDTNDAVTRGFGATLWIGHAVFEVISIKLRGPLDVILKPDLRNDLAPIWPRGFKLDWPNTPELTLRQVVSLGDRIAASGIRLVPQ